MIDGTQRSLESVIFEILEGPIADQDFRRQKAQMELAKKIAQAVRDYGPLGLEQFPGQGEPV